MLWRFIGGYSLLKENRDKLYIRALKSRRIIVDAFNNVLKDHDVILCPASPTVAPLFSDSIGAFNNNAAIADNYMAFANMGGHPSITIPLGFDNGLPFGINLTAKPFDEANLLAISQRIEDMTGLNDLVAKEDK